MARYLTIFESFRKYLAINISFSSSAPLFAYLLQSVTGHADTKDTTHNTYISKYVGFQEM